MSIGENVGENIGENTGDTGNALFLAPPTSFNIVDGTETQNKVDVTWTPPAKGGATEYRVYSQFGFVDSIAWPATGMTVTGLTAATSYTMYVVTSDGTGESLASNSDVIQTNPASSSGISGGVNLVSASLNVSSRAELYAANPGFLVWDAAEPTFVSDPLGSGVNVMFCDGGNEQKIGIEYIPVGATWGADDGLEQVMMEWDEYREDSYDWGGEKMNRMTGQIANGNVTLDYIMGGETDFVSTQPSRDPGQMNIFGNRDASNGANAVSTDISAGSSNPWLEGQYNRLGIGIKLTANPGTGTDNRGVADGYAELWLNGVLQGSVSNYLFRPATLQSGGAVTGIHTFDLITWGGWWSSYLPSQAPVPHARRYIKNITLKNCIYR